MQSVHAILIIYSFFFLVKVMLYKIILQSESRKANLATKFFWESCLVDLVAGNSNFVSLLLIHF